MAGRDTGMVFFMEEPSATVARWEDTGVSFPAAVAIMTAIHRDLLTNLRTAEGVALYIAPVADSDAAYVATLGGADLLQVPAAVAFRRWDSALSILYNRCGHRKILCADGRVPDLYPEDLERIRRKLDLYQVAVGREGGDGCWLLGMNGYQEILQTAQVQPDDVLHPLLQAAGQLQLEISVLDTKDVLRRAVDLSRLRVLARQTQHTNLRQALQDNGILTGTPPGP